MLVFYLSLLESESDKLLFTQIYTEYRDKMYSVAYSILGTKEKAEDAVHESFLKVIEHLETYKSSSEEEAGRKWLMVITKNTARDIIPTVVNKLTKIKR